LSRNLNTFARWRFFRHTVARRWNREIGIVLTDAVDIQLVQSCKQVGSNLLKPGAVNTSVTKLTAHSGFECEADRFIQFAVRTMSHDAVIGMAAATM
jgi:hypothetical protein